jgi:RND superfamily putative drug exporter
MTLLSITASFGAMVWISGQPLEPAQLRAARIHHRGQSDVMFSVIFGLSMDYEVLLPSRSGGLPPDSRQHRVRRRGPVEDRWRHHRGGLIVVSVFAAFALAEVITIKSIGVGMAIAVAIDATIVRILLVPATMRLMGKWNWWAPGILGRFADRLGFSHVEDEEDVVPQPVASPGLSGS